MRMWISKGLAEVLEIISKLLSTRVCSASNRVPETRKRKYFSED
jgi:hypothetical protein